MVNRIRDLRKAKGLTLADLAAPWTGSGAGGLALLPWPALAAVPPLAFLIGWATAQLTVRRWLRRLP